MYRNYAVTQRARYSLSTRCNEIKGNRARWRMRLSLVLGSKVRSHPGQHRHSKLSLNTPGDKLSFYYIRRVDGQSLCEGGFEI